MIGKAGVITTIQRKNSQRAQTVNPGQCGLCTHFGEFHEPDKKLAQIRTQHEAPEDLIDDCGHPRHASLHLKVTPISGCDGFEPADRSVH